MAALVAPGAPVSVLIDYGLAEEVVGHLVEAGVGTIEKLGAMTPEQLEEIPNVAPMVQQIQQAVISYYSQFEDQEQGDSAPEQNMPEAEPVSPDLSATAEEAAEVQGTQADELEIEPGPEAAELPESIAEVSHQESLLYDPDSAEERFEPGSEQELAETEAVSEQFGNMEDAGSSTHNQPEGAGSKDTPDEGHGG